MDDRRLRGAMVDEPPSASHTAVDKPFALKSIFYTVGFLVFVLGVVPSVFYLAGSWPETGAEARFVIHEFWTGFRWLVGAAVFSIGLAAYVFCSAWLIYFGRGPHVEFDPPRRFVATGPYRWVRNPVVICLIVTAVGQALYFSSLGMLVFVVFGMAFAQYQVTRIEEPRLRKRFGESYDEYCRQVPRWVPRPPRE